MVAVHAGIRPGRPTLLLLLSAGALAGTLGLAWWQASDALALADELHIEGTPLIVRPPRNWVRDADDPRAFLPPLRFDRRRAERWPRRVSFKYTRLDRFYPLDQLVFVLDQRDYFDSGDPRPSRIGPLDALQVRRVRNQRYRGRVYHQETVLRLACSPRGDVITVEYEPLTGLTTGDLDLLDQVCKHVRIDDPAFNHTPKELRERAGLSFPLADNWRMIGPDFAETPGLYVQASEHGVPSWSLGVFRTWLAEGRSPTDLLKDFAAQQWRLTPESVLPHAHYGTRRRLDLASIRNPAFGFGATDIASVWIVVQSPGEVAIIYAFADAMWAHVADFAAEELARSLEFAPSELLPSFELAKTAGTELAALLTKKGAMPWWGRYADRGYYLGDFGRQPRVRVAEHTPSARDRGYDGFTLTAVPRAPESGDVEVWSIDDRAAAYAYELQGAALNGNPLTRFSLREQRTGPGAPIRRSLAELRRGRRRVIAPEREFAVGDAFIAPPIEPLAETWVAQQSQGAWLIEVSTPLGVSSHTRLLRPLPPDEAGRPRVLRIIDFSPRGEVAAYSNGDVLENRIGPRGRIRRVDRDVIELRFPAVARRVRALHDSAVPRQP